MNDNLKILIISGFEYTNFITLEYTTDKKQIFKDWVNYDLIGVKDDFQNVDIYRVQSIFEPDWPLLIWIERKPIKTFLKEYFVDII